MEEVCPRVPGKIQHIQHIQHFKGFGADVALKFNIVRGLERLMPPNPLNVEYSPQFSENAQVSFFEKNAFSFFFLFFVSFFSSSCLLVALLLYLFFICFLF